MGLNLLGLTNSGFLAAITKIVEPRYYQEAAVDPNWRKAMVEEIQALEDNKTWTLVDLPPGKKAINTNGSIR